MMNEIYRKGPIVCSISTPRDFTYDYRGGIWANEPTKFEEIDHNVEVAPHPHPAHLHHPITTSPSLAQARSTGRGYHGSCM